MPSSVRYKVDSFHYLTPTEENKLQSAGMRKRGIFSSVNTEVGQIIVAEVNKERVNALLEPDRGALSAPIAEA